MSQSVHQLRGCRTQPLGHYLKALGVLRLVSEQADEHARGCWRDGHFVLITRLNEEELVHFFLNDYQPTPMVSPWNGGSGFYSDGGSKLEALSGIETSTAARLDPYRAAIATIRRDIPMGTDKPSGEEKAKLVRAVRKRSAGEFTQWVRAVATVDGAGDPKFPSILGTGGNDGNLEFANNYMWRLLELFDGETGAPTPPSPALLRRALFDQLATGLDSSGGGQFMPITVGGANASNGFVAKSLSNLWDYVLLLEGSLLFQGSMVRHLDVSGLPLAAAPFAFRASPVGYASSTQNEEPSRGEQWMPVFSAPTTVAELRRIFAEGRVTVGRRAAHRGVDAARALAALGVKRGINAFERYAYAERNGNNNFATPLGRFEVAARPHVRLLDEIAPWAETLRRAAQSTAPASIQRANRNLQRSLLACTISNPSAPRWQGLLLALGEAEAAAAAASKWRESPSAYAIRPLPALSAAWIEAVWDQSPEVRLALAMANKQPTDFKDNIGQRGHFLPLRRRKRALEFADKRAHPIGGVRASGPVDMARALLRRRLVMANQTGHGHLGLRARHDISARADDLARVERGEVDLARVVALARPLMALEIGTEGLDRAFRKSYYQTVDPGPAASPALMAIRLALPDGPPHGDERPIALEPAVVGALCGGRLAAAAQAALRRLKSSGLRPHLHLAAGDAAHCDRILATTLFPLSSTERQRFRKRLCSETQQTDTKTPAGDTQ